MIEVRQLSRNYGDLKAVQDVSFAIGRGEIVGLLGHNGAGKTTIMKMLTGFLEPSAGSIQIDNLDIITQRRAAQQRIGYLPENCPLYPEMTVLDALEYQATLHGLPSNARKPAIRRAIERTDLKTRANATIGTLSRGYRQRVGVAQAILHEPGILILDEPTNGLDPSQIQHMRDLVRELAVDATLIISTHVLQEVEAVCGRVLILRAGQLALDSTLNALNQSKNLLITLDRKPSDAQSVLKSIKGVTEVKLRAERENFYSYAVSINNSRISAPLVAREIIKHGYALYELAPERQNLEILFGAVTGTQVDSVRSIN